MKCPNCSNTLVMSERQGIEIDYCPECRGVWLDRGELDKIIEKSSAAGYQQATPPPQYNQHDKNSGYPKYKKKKSFLDDIFDF